MNNPSLNRFIPDDDNSVRTSRPVQRHSYIDMDNPNVYLKPVDANEYLTPIDSTEYLTPTNTDYTPLDHGETRDIVYQTLLTK